MGDRAAAIAAVALLCLAGCSGDDGDDAAPAATLEAVTTMTTTPPPASSRSLATTVEPAPDLLGYNIYRPSDLDATGAPLPVVVWANGGCFRHDATWQTLLERWAAAGFFVVAITEPPPDAPLTATDLTTADDQAMAIDWAVAQDDAIWCSTATKPHVGPWRSAPVGRVPPTSGPWPPSTSTPFQWRRAQVGRAAAKARSSRATSGPVGV